MEQNKDHLHVRHYDDFINDEKILFMTNADQEFIDGLSFNGEWDTVKQVLINFGYTVIEEPINN